MRSVRWAPLATLAVAFGCAQAGYSTPRVVLVQPSGTQVPENLLRITVRFAAQVEGPVLPRISLRRTDGKQIQQPFLEQELWSPDGKALTVLMHPGRVKTGLTAHEHVGPVLTTGETVILAFDQTPIKQWTVGPPDDLGPVTTAWKVSPVRAGTAQHVVVTFDGPIDGQDAGYLAIADSSGHRIDGHARLMDGEIGWAFTPNVPWQAGTYSVVVRGTLEDPCGNRPGGRFETPIYTPPGLTTDAVIPFFVASPSVRAAH